ncbi:MAG TPA: ATP-binding protein, partial [Candidatus Binatia bacterium]|nr:ATP-binding protein [Candidatus Binatia bacterium]
RQILGRAGATPLLSSLRVRLLLLVLLALLPALGLIVYSAVEQRRLGTDAAKLEAVRLVRVVSSMNERMLDGARQLLITLSQIDSVRTRSPVECTALFSNLMRLQPVYANIGGIDLEGNVFASAVPIAEPVDLVERPHFHDATNRLDVSLGTYQYNRVSRKSTVNVAYPIFDLSNRLAGVIFGALDLSWIRNVVTNSDLPRNVSITLSDNRRITLFRHPDPDGRFIGHSLEEFYPSRTFVERPLNEYMQERISAEPRLSRDGTWRLYATGPIEHRMLGTAERPPRVSVGVPLTVAYGEANRMLLRNVGFLGAVTLMALVAAWYAGDLFVLRRVRSLVDATQKLRSGNLSARTGVTEGAGELHYLARVFDDMAESLQQRIAERERAEAQLRVANAELKAFNEELERRVALRTAELKRSNEELEQFAYVASHDLQEPLRMVTNYMQLLQQRYGNQLDKNAHEFMGFAMDGALRMRQLIQDLLAYSRVGSRAKPFERIEAREILDRTLLNLKVAIDESGAVITWGDPLPVLDGDQGQLTQLFQNLISNAIKFCKPDHPPQIRISTKPAPPPKSAAAEEPIHHHRKWVEFSVTDNGIGISAENFERIFVIFQRLHARDKYPGTGIGLSICKKIVERHGGRIWVESRADVSTTFHFTLPVAS